MAYHTAALRGSTWRTSRRLHPDFRPARVSGTHLTAAGHRGASPTCPEGEIECFLANGSRVIRATQSHGLVELTPSSEKDECGRGSHRKGEIMLENVCTHGKRQ